MYADAVLRCRELKNYNPFFSNPTTLASYCFYSQIILLDSIEVNKLKLMDVDSQNKLITKLISHEITHFYDHIATTSGQNNLLKMMYAQNAVILQKPELFYNVVNCEADIRRSHFPKYFKTINKGLSDISLKMIPWKYRFSAGLEFNAKGQLDEDSPVLFCTFITQDDQYISRVPVSISSLYEVNAMNTENILFRFDLMQFNEDDKFVEIQNYSQEKIKFLYDEDFTIYTVAAHIISNICKISDMFTAYQFASFLSRFCLNLPDELFDQIRIPPQVEIWGPKNKAFLKIRDRGYLFLILCYWAEQIIDQITPKEWLVNIISRCGLPDLDSIIKMINEQMKCNAKEVEKLLTSGEPSIQKLKERYIYLLKVGQEVFNQVGFDEILYIHHAFTNIIPAPPILLADGNVFLFPQNKFDIGKYDIEESSSIAQKYHMFSHDFIGALKIGS